MLKKIRYYTIQDNKTGELCSYCGETRIYEDELDKVLDILFGGKDIFTKLSENFSVSSHEGYTF